MKTDQAQAAGCRPSCGLQSVTWQFNHHCFRVHPFLNKIWLYCFWTGTRYPTVGTGCSCCSGFTPIEEPTWREQQKVGCSCIVILFVSGCLLHISMFPCFAGFVNPNKNRIYVIQNGMIWSKHTVRTCILAYTLLRKSPIIIHPRKIFEYIWIWFKTPDKCWTWTKKLAQEGDL